MKIATNLAVDEGSYVPLKLDDSLPGQLRDYVRQVIDPAFEELRYLFTLNTPQAGPNGSLQRPILVYLLSVTDGIAQTLFKGTGGAADRFKGFLRDHFPWDIDPPSGLTKEEAADVVWQFYRCPFIHRLGLRYDTQGSELKVEVGRSFQNTNSGLSELESLRTCRPGSESTVKKTQDKIILWLDSFYWGVRIATEHLLSESGNWTRIESWHKSGGWDHFRNEKPAND